MERRTEKSGEVVLWVDMNVSIKKYGHIRITQLRLNYSQWCKERRGSTIYRVVNVLFLVGQCRLLFFGSSALRVVEAAPFHREEVQLWAEDTGETSHSLHLAFSYPDSFRSEIPAYFIRKYTKRGQVVLDPFAGSGTTALEAALQGRVAYAVDESPLAHLVTSAKLSPADITEVTLRLQRANLRRPINLDIYRQRFAAFYDVDTFREICNLRVFLKESPDRVSRFIELVLLSILHGHSAGYLSVYTSPQVSFTSQAQEELNFKRRQTPDYRAVVPRVLRKSASLLRDGIPSVLELLEKTNKVAVGDARDLSMIQSGSVDLIVTQPPFPGSKTATDDLWLKSWFLGLQGLPTPNLCGENPQGWIDFMNEFLFEAARVVKGGGRCVLVLKEVGRGVLLDEAVQELVNAHLSRFWDAECGLINTPKFAKVKNAVKDRDSARESERVLVLRRR